MTYLYYIDHKTLAVRRVMETRDRLMASSPIFYRDEREALIALLELATKRHEELRVRIAEIEGVLETV